MRTFFVALTLFVAVAHGGFFGESSGGASGGWELQGSSGWQQQQQQYHASQQQQQQQQQQEKKILIIKQGGGGGGHQNTGGSLTVSGPTHLIKTIHKVRTLDHGGRILSKSSGGGGQQAKVLIVKDIKHAQVNLAQGHQAAQYGGFEQQQEGWATQTQQGGW